MHSNSTLYSSTALQLFEKRRVRLNQWEEVIKNQIPTGTLLIVVYRKAKFLLIESLIKNNNNMKDIAYLLKEAEKSLDPE